MKRAGWVLSLMITGGCWSGTAVADTVPPASVSSIVKIVQVLDPSEERVFLFHGTGFLGTSASVLRLTSHHYPLASLRVGFADADPVTEVYLGESFDLPGIAERFTPESIKGYFANSMVAKAVSFIGRYARVSLIEGRNFRTGKGEFGISAGASVVATF